MPKHAFEITILHISLFTTNLVPVHTYFNKPFALIFKLRKRQIPSLLKSLNHIFVEYSTTKSLFSTKH